MLLSEAITFRYLSAQLTPPEMLQFFNKLIQQNTNIIFSALFHVIINKSSSDHEVDAQNINKLISNIIQSRPKKPAPIVVTIPSIKLDEVPKSLIGVIATFLNQSDYINFSKSNRSIYLGCNSPNKSIQQLDLTQITDYSSINLASFPYLKKLELNLSKLPELLPSLTGLTVMNRLKCITLNGDKKTDFEIDPFMTQNHINIDDITTLQCVNFGNEHSLFNEEKLTNILTKFHNIQYLHLLRVHTAVDADKLKDILSNLRGIQLIGGRIPMNRSLITTFGDKLDYLAFKQAHHTDYNLSNLNFNKLEQLRLRRPTNKTINDILNTAINLKKLRIAFIVNGKTFMTAKQIKESIVFIMASCKRLEYVEFEDDGTWIQSILEGVEKGLFETKTRKRRQIKVAIALKCDNQINPSDFTVNIGNIIHWLECSEINDFMLIWCLMNCGDSRKRMKVLDGLKQISCISKVQRYQEKFVIFNENCKINGWNEAWKI